jgi:hypothetical protein
VSVEEPGRVFALNPVFENWASGISNIRKCSFVLTIAVCTTRSAGYTGLSLCDVSGNSGNELYVRREVYSLRLAGNDSKYRPAKK